MRVYAYLQFGSRWEPRAVVRLKKGSVHVMVARGENLSGEEDEVFATITQRYGPESQAQIHHVQPDGRGLIAFRAERLQ